MVGRARSFSTRKFSPTPHISDRGTPNSISSISSLTLSSSGPDLPHAPGLRHLQNLQNTRKTSTRSALTQWRVFREMPRCTVRLQSPSASIITYFHWSPFSPQSLQTTNHATPQPGKPPMCRKWRWDRMRLSLKAWRGLVRHKQHYRENRSPTSSRDTAFAVQSSQPPLALPEGYLPMDPTAALPAPDNMLAAICWRQDRS
ncbi:hypothetical protein P154DRAFT_580587 [Amniculicola lignicola CBS 123094]|uniref:Uncharacterized protein n=1 Tax=Amniculicola lignicola CBS 123094 TaxID=1392246 RepID=A0A6A5W449_9PLEO|nr:hypothetical protein P154DRAFT_580587 [Amniculicola lignicola CBS 123094]